jgi:hypothetical protein
VKLTAGDLINLHLHPFPFELCAAIGWKLGRIPGAILNLGFARPAPRSR